MTDATTNKGGKAAGAKRTSAAAPTRSTVSAAITPAAALARHIDWLEFALAAARSEEAWRVARLEKSTKKSRDKRTSRLAEVRSEIAELGALVVAIRGVTTRPVGRPKATATKGRSTGPRKPRTPASTSVAATSQPATTASAGAAPRRSTATATRKRSTATATRKRSTTTATRKRSTAAKPAGSASTPRRRRPAGPATEGPATDGPA
jgi:DNA-binding protein HU-beta